MTSTRANIEKAQTLLGWQPQVNTKALGLIVKQTFLSATPTTFKPFRKAFSF
jgi:hypothetical protein